MSISREPMLSPIRTLPCWASISRMQYQLSDLKIRFKSGSKIVKRWPLKPDRLTFKDSGEYRVWVKRLYRLHCRTNI